MAITYPIAMPAMPPGPKQIQLVQNFLVGEFDSPFTGQGQIYEQQGSWWSAKVDLPFLTRAQAAPWLAFLAALNGRSGTFLFGDPTVLGPLGSAAQPALVSAAGQTGKTLTLAALTGVLKAGDYFQIGGENRLLYSQGFDNAVWAYANCTRPGSPTIVAPDGTTTAYPLVYTSSGNTAQVKQILANLTAGQTYTFSCWLKAPAGTPTLNLLAEETASFAVLVNTVMTMSGSWQRFSVTFNPISGSTMVFLYNPSAATTYHAWGAQVELGSEVSLDYFPTTSAAQPSTRRLHMAMGDVTGNSCTIDIFPRLRESPIVGYGRGYLQFVNPQGQFRLDANALPYIVDNAGHYSISFGAREAF